ncbi:jg19898 [Pararge aegeria aegeria]|uniref:Jg19898 protein n=1 Tax=Pararge aegeria aegeria TaxID=348720 RepID=A0A8S4SJQ1_9NEOP|nr:jg19898 [Pararge aegeria aegeria]
MERISVTEKIGIKEVITRVGEKRIIRTMQIRRGNMIGYLLRHEFITNVIEGYVDGTRGQERPRLVFFWDKYNERLGTYKEVKEKVGKGYTDKSLALMFKNKKEVQTRDLLLLRHHCSSLRQGVVTKCLFQAEVKYCMKRYWQEARLLTEFISFQLTGAPFV